MEMVLIMEIVCSETAMQELGEKISSATVQLSYVKVHKQSIGR